MRISKTQQNKQKLKDLYKVILNNIKWSNNKTSFSYLAGINRPIYPVQVTKICKSIEKMGVLRPVVATIVDFINGKPTMYIIDGQHLFNACIRLGYDVPYVIIPIGNKVELVETIALLNSSSKSWSIQDYVTAWSALKPDYVKLNHYFQVYDIEISTIASVLGGYIVDNASGAKRIKDGSFTIVNEPLNVQILNNLTDVLKIVPRMNRFENKYTCREYVKFLRTTEKYDHKAFMDKLKKNKDKFVLATQEEGKLSELFKKLS